MKLQTPVEYAPLEERLGYKNKYFLSAPALPPRSAL